MQRRTLIAGAVAAWAAKPQSPETGSAAHERVRDVERAFAATMERRDFAAFSSYISVEAVFLSGAGSERPVHRGRRAIALAWKRYFDGPTPPFSWSPDVVEVLDSGKLALTTGPVRNAQGELTGRFTSIWRLEDDGKWRIVFDRGCPLCR